jgi:hypothetical protein
MADSTDRTPAGEEASRLYHCTYCPRPGADVCIRDYPSTSGSGHSIHAHRACAEAHGDNVLYTLTAPTGRAS